VKEKNIPNPVKDDAGMFEVCYLDTKKFKCTNLIGILFPNIAEVKKNSQNI
jgi:hypothetical protein